MVTVPYDTVYLKSSQKLTGSLLSLLLHKINQKIKTKNELKIDG